MPAHMILNLDFLRSWRLSFSFAILAGLATSCGYSFQLTRSPIFEKYQVRRIYIASFTNETFKPGVENLMYNEVVRAISASKRVIVVGRPEEADAIFKGGVATSEYGKSSDAYTTTDYSTGILAKVPVGLRPQPNILYASDYQATLGCNFSLTVNHSGLLALKKDNGTVIWTDSRTRSKTFPGNNQIATFGSTSALINDSEFDRALRELARLVASDVQESMFSAF